MQRSKELQQHLELMYEVTAGINQELKVFDYDDPPRVNPDVLYSLIDQLRGLVNTLPQSACQHEGETFFTTDGAYEICSECGKKFS